MPNMATMTEDLVSGEAEAWFQAAYQSAARPGSPWWRAVNERLLRDKIEAELLWRNTGDRYSGSPSAHSVLLWAEFLRQPSPASWFARTTRAFSARMWNTMTWC